MEGMGLKRKDLFLYISPLLYFLLLIYMKQFIRKTKLLLNKM